MQPSVSNFFAAITPNEFHDQSKTASHNVLPTIPPPTQELRKTMKKERKKKNMQDLRDRKKAKEIKKGIRNEEGKCIKQLKNG